MQELWEEHTEVLARVVWAHRRPSALWLVGAGVAFSVATAVTVFAPQQTHTIAQTTLLALDREAAEIGRAVDATARVAHDRAAAIAGTTMMRAAILTDAATVADMMTSEFRLELAPGEIVELYQSHDATLETLIRVPETAAALPRRKDDTTTIQLDSSSLRVVAGAHIERLKDGAGYDAAKAGLFVLAVPVDLGAISRRLSEHAVDATLSESGPSVHLVRQLAVAAGELVRIPVPTRTGKLTLTAAPRLTTARVRWVDVVRTTALAVGGAMLIAFTVIAVLRRRRPARR